MNDFTPSSPEDTRIDIALMGVILLTVLQLFAMSAMIGMPFNINGIVRSFGVNNAAAGLAATLEIAGMALSTIVFAKVATQVPARRIYVPAILAIISANLAAIWAPTLELLYGCRGIAGFASGAVIATIMATAGRSKRPEFTFAAFSSGAGMMAMLMAVLLPQALKFHESGLFPDAMSAVDGLYGVYVVFAVLSLLFIRLVPIAPLFHKSAAERNKTHTGAPLIGWVALCGLSLLFFGGGALIIFLVNIATEQVQISAEAAGLVLILGSALIIVLPLVASWLTTFIPAVILMCIMLAVFGVTGVLLGSVKTPIALYLIAPLVMGLPAAMMPIVLGALARIDPSGQLAGIHPAFLTSASMFAPIAGGAISSTGNYSVVGWLLGGCVAIATPMLFAALRQSDRSRHREPASVE